jgi:N-acetylglucosaminyl-diphospho-decaprenol L-rhamnosyltransferase
MSISGQNLSIVIVTLKSEGVIHDCIQSINSNLPIVVVENSNNYQFKKNLETKYKNVQCILSNKNIGMGSGNNIGIKYTQTDFVFIINPDVTFEPNTLDELIKASKILQNFSILAPISTNINFPNFEKLKGINYKEKSNEIFKVKSVDGFAMLIDKRKFKNNIFFDENFFMYLENDDLCKRVINNNGSIFVSPKAKINHAGAKAVDAKYFHEVEFSRNWHWIWSKFYFNKKHFGLAKALVACGPSYFTSIIKFLFFFIIRNNFKKKIYFNRASGFYNALLGKPSWYRPNFNS